MNHQGFVVQIRCNRSNREPLCGRANKRHLLNDTLRMQLCQRMTGHKRAKRETSNRQWASWRNLINHTQEITRFASARIVLTCRSPNTTKIKTHHCPAALHKSTCQRLHHFVVHRAAKQWVWVRNDGHAA